MAADNTKNTNYFPELTGVRAIAAMMVYFHHYNPFSAQTFGNAFTGIVNEMHTGVTLFFVLSGFLIGNRYSDLKNFDFRRYFLFRVARIYPMYFLLTTATFLLPYIPTFHIGFYEKVTYFANITFLRGFSDDLKFTLIPQGWSLTVEETFYLLAPLFFFCINRRWVFLLVFPLFFYLCGEALTAFFTKHPFWGLFKTVNFTMIYTFFGRASEFFIGIAMALYVKKQADKNIAKPRFGYATYTGVAMILLSLFGMYLLADEKNDIGLVTLPGKWLNNVVMPLIGIAPLYYGLITEDTWLARVLRSKLFVLLGKASYIFYLIHMGIFRNLLPHFDVPWLDAVAHIVMLQVFSIILFTFIEEPLNNLIRKKVITITNRNRQTPNPAG